MRQVKTVYCLMMISAAMVLASVGGLLGIITAVLLLAGALPMLSVAQRRAAAHERERVLREVTNVIAPQDHQDSHQSAPATPDHQTTPRSVVKAPRALDRS